MGDEAKELMAVDRDGVPVTPGQGERATDPAAAVGVRGEWTAWSLQVWCAAMQL